jgi:hypothetical protein
MKKIPPSVEHVEALSPVAIRRLGSGFGEVLHALNPRILFGSSSCVKNPFLLQSDSDLPGQVETSPVCNIFIDRGSIVSGIPLYMEGKWAVGLER